MSLTNFYARLQGKYRRTLCTYCAHRRIPIKLSRPIVSFTFDDFPASAYHVGAAILEKYGITGTYYTSLGLAGKVGPVGHYFSESDLPGLISRGHELGCHTFDHCHAWLTPPGEYEQSIVRNRERLRSILPGAVFTTHSYPINYPRPHTKTIASKYFQCVRGGEQRANESVADANYLLAFFIERSRGKFPAIKAQIDHAKATSSWLIFATHDLSSAPSPFGCTPELFEAVVSYAVGTGIRVLPVSRAFALLSS